MPGWVRVARLRLPTCLSVCIRSGGSGMGVSACTYMCVSKETSRPFFPSAPLHLLQTLTVPQCYVLSKPTSLSPCPIPGTDSPHVQPRAHLSVMLASYRSRLRDKDGKVRGEGSGATEETAPHASPTATHNGVFSGENIVTVTHIPHTHTGTCTHDPLQSNVNSQIPTDLHKCDQ